MFTHQLQTEVLIVGCGLTGLTTAFNLKKEGVSFIAVDKLNRVGGVIETCCEKGFVYEKGPNTGIIGNRYVVKMFDDIAESCSIEIANNNVSKRFILKNKTWHHLPRGIVEAIKTPLFTSYDKLRIIGEPFRKRGTNPHETLSSFVRRRLGQSFLDYAIDPFISGIYAGDPNYLIPKYALPKLYNIEQKYGSLILGSIKKMIEPKNKLEKQVTKKIFSCKNGLTSLTNTLFKKSGVNNFILNIARIKIDKTADGFLSHITHNDGKNFTIFSKKVITTVGAYELPKIITFINVNDLNQITNLHYTKVVQVAIGFNKWNGISLDGFGGLIPSKENRKLLGILFMSSLFEGRAPKQGALINVFMGGFRQEELITLNDDEIKKIVTTECSELLQINHFIPDVFHITRHKYAIPQYGIDSGKRFETVAYLEKKYKGLYLGGNLRNGIGIADRIEQGFHLAENCINDNT